MRESPFLHSNKFHPCLGALGKEQLYIMGIADVEAFENFRGKCSVYLDLFHSCSGTAGPMSDI